DGIAGPGQHRRGDEVDGGPGRLGSVEQRLRGVVGGEHVGDGHAGVERLGQEDGAVDDEGARLRARSAAPRGAPQLLDPWVPGPDRTPTARCYAGSLDEASLAAFTRAANAAGSRTARSARTLRSTSISASRSPAMNRL